MPHDPCSLQLLSACCKPSSEALKRCHAPAEAAHTFTAQAQDWGFIQFALQNDILDVRNGYLVDDTLVLKVRQLWACTTAGLDGRQHLSCCRVASHCLAASLTGVASSTSLVRTSLNGQLLDRPHPKVACSSCALCPAALSCSSLPLRVWQPPA